MLEDHNCHPASASWCWCHYCPSHSSFSSYIYLLLPWIKPSRSHLSLAVSSSVSTCNLFSFGCQSTCQWNCWHHIPSKSPFLCYSIILSELVPSSLTNHITIYICEMALKCNFQKNKTKTCSMQNPTFQLTSKGSSSNSCKRFYKSVLIYSWIKIVQSVVSPWEAVWVVLCILYSAWFQVHSDSLVSPFIAYTEFIYRVPLWHTLMWFLSLPFSLHIFVTRNPPRIFEKLSRWAWPPLVCYLSYG